MPCPFCKRPSASPSSSLCSDALSGRNCIELTRTQAYPALKRDQLVYFGRAHGEQTLGEVIKVNAKTVKVRQLEARGALKSHAIGTVWNVGRSFVTPAPEGTKKPDVPDLIEHNPPGQAPGSWVPGRGYVGTKRPEAVIMAEIQRVYCQLSPESLSCDGELSRREVQARSSALNKRLQALFTELGRRVDENEAFRTAGH